MKCRYRFSVDTTIRPTFVFPIEHAGYLWEFEVNDGRVSHLNITMPLPDPAHWPKVIKNPSPGISAFIDPNLVHLPFIQFHLRSIQGVLAMFGVRGIGSSEIDVRWFPESKDESAKLGIKSYSSKENCAPRNDNDRFPFDLLARAIVGGIVEGRLEMPLNFFVGLIQL